MKRTKYRWKPKRKKSALQIWMSSILACRPTLVSARQIRKARYTLRKTQPELHKKMKIAARTQRSLTRKLNDARVSWSRKLWEGRRKAEGKSTNDRHFPGVFKPSPRRSSKWFKHLTRKPKGSTRTPSPISSRV